MPFKKNLLTNISQPLSILSISDLEYIRFVQKKNKKNTKFHFLNSLMPRNNIGTNNSKNKGLNFSGKINNPNTEKSNTIIIRIFLVILNLFNY